MRAQGLRDLDRERADAAARAVDEDALSRHEMAMVAKALQRRGRRDAHRRGLREGQLLRLPHEATLERRRPLGERATAKAEDLVARPESGHVLPDRLDDAGEVRAADGIVLLAHQLRDDREEEPAVDRVPVQRVDRGRAHPDEHAVVVDRGLLDLSQVQCVR